ncbi:MAG: isoprenylcysteine carboxylmethyltransferase family protein [Sphingomonadales bacterium]|nr:isoprenylcysteine carboxylmethyltransferase family protein [Sphingomonadales bacterium]
MFYILLFYLAFFFAALVLPTLRVWRRGGINPLVLPANDSVDGFVGLWFKLLVGGLGAYLFALALGLTAPLGAIAVGAATERQVAGWTLLIASLVWVVLAQVQMGASWRIGIDTQRKTDLVASGLFRISRNPIFLGMMIQLFGLFLLQPDAVTLLVLVCGYVLISVQIRLEEDHLRRQHGEAYAEFSTRVRRWM